MLKLKNEIIDGSQYTYVYIVTNKTLYIVPSWRVATNNNGTGVSSVTIYMLSQSLLETINKLELSYIEDELYNGIKIGHGVFGGW